DKVHQIVLNDRRLKVSEIVDAADTSSKRVFKILNGNMDMRK
ncbi:hypothetical protein EAI_05956, partial [Harpegnathos saltator]